MTTEVSKITQSKAKKEALSSLASTGLGRYDTVVIMEAPTKNSHESQSKCQRLVSTETMMQYREKRL